MVTRANILSRLVSPDMSPYPTDIRVAIVQYKLARYLVAFPTHTHRQKSGDGNGVEIVPNRRR